MDEHLSKQHTILLIESSNEDALFFKGLLKNNPFLSTPCLVLHAKTLADALSLVGVKKIDLILTNLFLPDSMGVETFIKLHHTAPSVPIVVLTNETDETLALEAVSRGAQDYISKAELNLHFFDRMICFAIEREHVTKTLRTLIFTDEMTKIYNRRGFFHLAENQLEIRQRMKKECALFLLDVDYLKEINDTYGHSEGDKALLATTECLTQTFRRSDVIGRLGGDEFAIFALNITPAKGKALLEDLDDKLRLMNAKKKHPFELSFSCGGVYLSSDETATLEDLLKAADEALYVEKKRKIRRSLSS
jgi:two-component system cell cycle response regulator